MKSYTFYVASKYEKRPEVARIIAALRARGHRVVGDWTPHTTEGVAPADVQRTLRAFAMEDYDAAAKADHFVILHDDHCRGAFAELGIALHAHRRDPLTVNTSRRQAIVIGGAHAAPTLGPIFYCMPEVVHVDTVEQMLKRIDDLAAEEG